MKMVINENMCTDLTIPTLLQNLKFRAISADKDF